VYIDYDVRRAILKFNKTNGDFRIQVTDYSEYNTEANGWTGANDRLNADIITGKIPDIISLNGLNVRNFINKGILTDIYALIDASETASREDYLPEILAAGETNGKLYSFLPSFYVQTVAAKKSIVGDRTGWTLDDLNGILRSLPAGTQSFSMMTRTDILNLCYQQAMDQFIDWDAGKCDFGENFAKLLEFVKTFPEEIDWDKIYVDESSYMDMQNAYKQDKAILQQAYVGGYRAIRDFSEQFGAEVTFVGFPTESGNGSSLIANGMDFGISARSSNKQVCFDFLAGLVQTEPNFLQSSGYFYGGFSISKAYMDKVREYELTPLRERPGYIPEDYDGGILRDRLVKYASTSSVVAVPAPVPEPDYSNGDDQLGYGPDGTMTKGEYEAGFALTQAEVDAVDRLIASAKRFYSEDTEVSNIILEEAAEFFSGRKTALDVANMIQSRVSLYVSENS
ncbi:MAG: extracellular solute-binding protein, partial [Oscillospiraceae bacterium]|jgi:ABC-type glycerol-3-phosphate transport system substrate-binding protein|nr:extracellular solute-binding protein [Oscillospiraceae bacterium]